MPGLLEIVFLTEPLAFHPRSVLDISRFSTNNCLLCLYNLRCAPSPCHILFPILFFPQSPFPRIQKHIQKHILNPREYLLRALGPVSKHHPTFSLWLYAFLTILNLFSSCSLLARDPPAHCHSCSCQIPLPREFTWLFCSASSNPPAKNRGRRMTLCTDEINPSY